MLYLLSWRVFVVCSCTCFRLQLPIIYWLIQWATHLQLAASKIHRTYVCDNHGRLLRVISLTDVISKFVTVSAFCLITSNIFVSWATWILQSSSCSATHAIRTSYIFMYLSDLSYFFLSLYLIVSTFKSSEIKAPTMDYFDRFHWNLW